MKNRNRLCQARSAGVILRTSATHPMLATFTAKVETLNSADLRTLYAELFAQEMPFECIDIVLNRLMDLDGVEAVDAFIDTVG